jgi:YVTN family beta-propeller protein
VAANPRTGKVYVSNSADGTVTIIDGVSRSVITTIPVATNTGGIAIDTATNLVYVGSLINVAGTDVPFLSKIDGSTDAVIATDTVRLRGASAPGAIAVNAANGRAFVIMRNDSLGVVDLVARTLVDSLGNLGFNLGGVAVNTLTSRVYVGSASEIRVIDGAPGVDTVFTDVVLGANSAQGLSVNEARNKIYVAHANNTLVYEIDGVSNQYRFIIVGTSISDTPQSTAVNPVTGKVYVPRANALTVMKYFSN